MTITRSELEKWTPEAHTQAGSYLTQEAGRADEVFGTAHAQVDGSTWTGAGSDGAKTHYAGNKAAVSAHGALLRTSAQTMTTAAETLGNIKNEQVGLVTQTEGQQFSVADDWTVTDVSGAPDQIKQFREPARQTFETALKAGAAAFEQAHQGVTATLTGHATSIGGFQFPDWHTEQHDDPNWRNYDPDYPTPATPYEAAHHGSNFNDNVKIDTSRASDVGGGGPSWLDAPTVKPDWPPSLIGQPPTPGGSFLPKLMHDLAAPPTGATPPPLQIQTPNGTLYPLPPARSFPGFGPSSYQTPAPPNPFQNLNPSGMPPAPAGGGTLQQGINDGGRWGLPALTPTDTPAPYPANHPPPLGPAPWDSNHPPPPLQTNGYTGGGHVSMTDYHTLPQDPWVPPPMPPPMPQPQPLAPVAPLDPPDPPPLHNGLPQPPQMYVPPPNDGLMTGPAPVPDWMPPEQRPEWSPGSLLGNIGMGCLAGAGFGATAGILVPPAEVALPEIGCVEGAAGGAALTLLGPAVNNMFNGNG